MRFCTHKTDGFSENAKKFSELHYSIVAGNYTIPHPKNQRKTESKDEYPCHLEPPKVRIFSMDEKGRDKERTLELHEIIGDVLRKSKEVILVGDDILIVPQSILTYRARALLFMYAHTYFLIVQSVTNTFIGWVDLELNMYYQMIVDDIKELLASNECKDFPGEFKPFNESIFPETGILKIGWRGFAPDCADFLSKAQQYFHDMPKPANSELDYEYISQKFSVIKDKAHEYASKAKRLCDEHNKKETTPPKESVIHEYKKSTKVGQTKKKPSKSKEKKKKFQPWKKSGNACFIIEDNRIKFCYKQEAKDLRLRNGSNPHKLLFLFAAKNPLPQVEIKDICTKRTRPSDIAKQTNTKLNEKIAAMALPDVPKDIEFVKYDDKSKCYGLSLEIKHKDDVDYNDR